jgi:hypothetical protein
LIVFLVFLCFVDLWANVLHGVIKEGMIGEKNGIGLFAKLKLEMHLIQCLHKQHSLSMKLRKLGRPPTQ